ncbi:MAG: nuclear transport factor 2 family protein [Gammaproteobacteria bacterium]
MADLNELERRIQILEHREEIRELVARYGIVIDNRDLVSVGECFCRDGGFRSKDGVMNARGRGAVIEQFKGRYAALGPTNHFVHEHIIHMDDDDPEHATGLVTSHAEVVRNNEPMWVAMRYEDDYRIEEGCWRFQDRVLSFFYYLPVKDYSQYLGELERMRAYEKPQKADYPEALPTWDTWRDVPTD